LEVENLLQALSKEMLKLKSASEHYEETKENLQKMCTSLDKISQTHRELTDRVRQVIAEMEKANLENKKTRELVQSSINIFEVEARQHEKTVEASLSKKFDEIRDEIRKQNDIILQNNLKQAKALKLNRYLILAGVILGAVIIIRLLLF
jgi:hypothetical protein